MDYKEISNQQRRYQRQIVSVDKAISSLNKQITSLDDSIQKLVKETRIRKKQTSDLIKIQKSHHKAYVTIQKKFDSNIKKMQAVSASFSSATKTVAAEMAKEIARAIPRTAFQFAVEKMKESAKLSKEAAITVAKMSTKPITLPVNFTKELVESIQQSEFHVNTKDLLTLATGSPVVGKIVRTILTSPLMKSVVREVKDVFKSIGRTMWRAFTLPARLGWKGIKKVGAEGKEFVTRSKERGKELYAQKIAGEEVPTLQKGGYVKKAGVVKVHPAEVVSPVEKVLGFKKYYKSLIQLQKKQIFELRLLRGATVGIVGGINQAMAGFFLKHPVFANLIKSFKIFSSVIEAPIKFLRRRRGGYWRDLPKGGVFGGSPFSQMVDILGALYANLLHKQDVIINMLKQIGYRIVDPTRGGKGWGPMIVKEQETWTVSGVIRRAGSLFKGLKALWEIKKQEKREEISELASILLPGLREDLTEAKGFLGRKAKGAYEKVSPIIESSRKFLEKQTKQIDEFLEDKLGETYTKVKTTTETAIESVSKQAKALQTAVSFKFDELKLDLEWKARQAKRNLKNLNWYKIQGKRILSGEGAIGLIASILAGPLMKPLMATGGWMKAEKILGMPREELGMSDRLIAALGQVMSTYTGYMFGPQMAKQMYYMKELATAETPEERRKALKQWKTYSVSEVKKVEKLTKRVTSKVTGKLTKGYRAPYVSAVPSTKGSTGLIAPFPAPALRIGAKEIKEQGLYYLHKSESVLPPELAEQLRDFFSDKKSRVANIGTGAKSYFDKYWQEATKRLQESKKTKRRDILEDIDRTVESLSKLLKSKENLFDFAKKEKEKKEEEESIVEKIKAVSKEVSEKVTTTVLEKLAKKEKKEEEESIIEKIRTTSKEVSEKVTTTVLEKLTKKEKKEESTNKVIDSLSKLLKSKENLFDFAKKEKEKKEEEESIIEKIRTTSKEVSEKVTTTVLEKFAGLKAGVGKDNILDILKKIEQHTSILETGLVIYKEGEKEEGGIPAIALPTEGTATKGKVKKGLVGRGVGLASKGIKGTAKLGVKIVATPYNVGAWVLNQFASAFMHGVSGLWKLGMGVADIFIQTFAKVTTSVMKLANKAIDTTAEMAKMAIKTTKLAFKGFKKTLSGIKKGVFGLADKIWGFVTLRGVRRKIGEKITSTYESLKNKAAAAYEKVKEWRKERREYKLKLIQAKAAKKIGKYVTKIYEDLHYIKKVVHRKFGPTATALNMIKGFGEGIVGTGGGVISAVTIGAIVSGVVKGIWNKIKTLPFGKKGVETATEAVSEAAEAGGVATAAKIGAKKAAKVGAEEIGIGAAKAGSKIAARESEQLTVAGYKIAAKEAAKKKGLLSRGFSFLKSAASKTFKVVSESKVGRGLAWIAEKTGIKNLVKSLGKTGKEIFAKWGEKGLSLAKNSPFFKWAASRIEPFLSKAGLKSIPVAGIIAQLGFGLWDILHADSWQEKLAIALGTLSGVGAQVALDATGVGALVSGVGGVATEVLVKNAILQAFKKKHKELEKNQKKGAIEASKEATNIANRTKTITPVKIKFEEVEKYGEKVRVAKGVLPGVRGKAKKDSTIKGVISRWGRVAQWASAEVQKRTNVSVPPQLILGVIAQESAGNPAAKSWVGASGLMQIMPRTAKGLSRQLGVPANRILTDPKANVLAGTFYLANLYRMFNDWSSALSAYNWGPGNMKKYLAGTKTTMPRETRNYAPGVLANVDKVVRLAGATTVAEAPELGGATTMKTAMVTREARTEATKQERLFEEMRKGNKEVKSAIESGTKTNVAMMAPVVNNVISNNTQTNANNQAPEKDLDSQLEGFLADNVCTV